MNFVSTTMRCAVFCVVFAAPSVAAAESVDLKAYDGSTTMTGTLLDYDDGSYLLDTPLGELRLGAQIVSCEGAGCPPAAVVEADLLAHGDIMMFDPAVTDGAAFQSPVYCPITNAIISGGNS